MAALIDAFGHFFIESSKCDSAISDTLLDYLGIFGKSLGNGVACIILDPPKNGEILRNSELGRSGLRKKMRRSFLGGKVLLHRSLNRRGADCLAQVCRG